MTNSVTVNGNTYTDGSDPATGLAAGGHRTRLVPMLSDAVVDLLAKQTACAASATSAGTQATNAAASAATALAAPGTNATSVSALTVGTGAKALTIQTGKSLVVGASVKIADTVTPTNWMYGDITAYNSGTGALTVNVTATNGSGTVSAWTVSLSGPIAPNFATRSTRTANTILDVGDRGRVIEFTANTFTQTFTAAATLGSGWFAWLRNSGTGDVTLDPNGAELIDGLTSFIMYPGESRLVTCDGAGFTSIVLAPFTKVPTSSGTWVKPPGYQNFELVGGGAAGGGGSGAAYLWSTYGITCGGGGPGGPGGAGSMLIPSSALGATENFTIGTGGAGAPTNAGPANGSAGSAGGNTTFGSIFRAGGGGGGGGGNVTGSGNTGTTGTAGTVFPAGGLASTQGGSGGQSSNSASAGTAGVSISAGTGGIGTTTAGGLGGAAATNGSAGNTDVTGRFATGGGGGGSNNTAAAAGSGANGTKGAGGGGGGGNTGTGVAGGGGNGGDGFLIIIGR